MLSMQGIVLVGHSTGCQDAVRYAQRCRTSSEEPPLLGVVLQAPVSDREYLATLPSTGPLLEKAQKLLEQGQGEEICGRAHDFGGAPVTARRWHALAAAGGDDDLFSSDLTDGQLRSMYGPLAQLPALLLISGSDEYVPAHVDLPALGRRLAAAIGSSAKAVVVEGGVHTLEGHEAAACDAIAEFASRLQP